MKKAIAVIKQFFETLDSVEDSERIETELYAISSVLVCVLLAFAAAAMRANHVPPSVKTLVAGHMIFLVFDQTDESFFARPLGAIAVVCGAWYQWFICGVKAIVKNVKGPPFV